MYIEYSDLKKGAYEETLRVLQREEQNAEQAINDAIGEVNPYLSNIYNLDLELAKAGEQRNKFLVKLIRDIAIYNIYCISSPSSMSETRRLKYEDSIKFLNKVLKQEITIPNLEKLAAPTTGGSYGIGGGSLTRRNNHY